jgi:hypothetical protein
MRLTCTVIMIQFNIYRKHSGFIYNTLDCTHTTQQFEEVKSLMIYCHKLSVYNIGPDQS